jgi:hypothetical protein
MKMFRTAAATLLLFVASTSAVLAADADSSAVSPSHVEIVELAGDTDWSLEPLQLGSRQDVSSRGSVLPALYVSLAALNAYDGYSTNRGLARGAKEANPFMKGLASNSAALWAVKGAAAGASIAVAERLWRKHRRVEAIAVMVVSNGMMAVVAARNASVLRQVR